MSSIPLSSKDGSLPPITIEGASLHNLQVSLSLQRKKLSVITGLSGSGKSSLAFGTLFLEGQRRYIESLNPYVRQFLGKLDKPPVKKIVGLPPTIGLSQKGRSHNSRARVSTASDIYPYLRILFARLGKTYSPISGQTVKKHKVKDVIQYILNDQRIGEILILSSLHLDFKQSVVATLETEQRKGFSRLFYEGEIYFIEDLLNNLPIALTHYYVVIDRISIQKNKKVSFGRLTESIEMAFFEGEGRCWIHHKDHPLMEFNQRFEADGLTFEEPNIHFFSFNSAQGACSDCTGLGKRVCIDPKKVIPDEQKSILEGAVIPFKHLKALDMEVWWKDLLIAADAIDFPLTLPYIQWSKEQRKQLWEGRGNFKGLHFFFDHLAKKTYKIQYRILLARYRSYNNCQNCQGSGIRKDAFYVKIGGKSLPELLLTSIEELSAFFTQLSLTKEEQLIAKVPLEEITTRLGYLRDVGLGYLTLHRSTDTLSGGEYQRIKLIRSLGSSLVDALYVLDEPTIGLDLYNTEQLIKKVLRSLQAIGNTVLIVEHEEDVIRAADEVIEIGPKSGIHGGKVVFQGSVAELEKNKHTYTAAYLSGRKRVERPVQYRKAKHHIYIKGMRQHNLKNIDLKIALRSLNVLTGMSGSGKSTIVDQLLYPALKHHLGLSYGTLEVDFDELTGDLNQIEKVAYFGQNALGRSARSNPATYLNAYDAIRQLFSQSEEALKNNFGPGHFSFNTSGGRCAHCQGVGKVTIDMQFMADITLTCEVCEGKRFEKKLLQAKFKGKNIAEVLEMGLEESLDFFKDYPSIVDKIAPAVEIGLGYLALGQSCSSLSGGEAQRLKLSTYLQSEREQNVFFIFDEPTRGLHIHDINYLMRALQRLVDKGHTVLVIEHNLEVIQSADWLIELGKGGGALGGWITYMGDVVQFVQKQKSYLAKKLATKWTRAYGEK